MKKTAFIVMLFAALAAAGCVTVKPPAAAPSSLPPTILTFEASPASVAAGEIVTLRWEVSNASSVNIDQGIGSVALRGNRAVSPAATTKYTLTATNYYGSTTASAQVTVLVPPPAPPASTNLPEVLIFAAQPPNIAAGEAATLTWQVNNSFDVAISPGLSIIPPSGSVIISPLIPTTYRLTATNGQGSIVATTTLTVSAFPPTIDTAVVNYFTATPYVIQRGGASVLSWKTTGGASVVIDNGLGTVDGTGTKEVSPQQTTTYMLTVTSASGGQFQTVTVNVR